MLGTLKKTTLSRRRLNNAGPVSIHSPKKKTIRQQIVNKYYSLKTDYYRNLDKIDYNKLFAVLSALPKYDFLPNSSRFYASKSKYIGNYTSLPLKMKKLKEMIKESQKQYNAFIQTIAKNHSFDLVNDSSEVTHNRIFIKDNIKTRASVLRKLQRPDILSKNPKYQLEHMRDTYRFKIVVHSLDDAVRMIYLMNKYLFKGGFTPKNVLKMDIFKLIMPKIWGWRFIAFDFIFDSGLIVECYITLRDMDIQKKLSNHKLFEHWRDRNFSELSVAAQKRYRRDIKKSFDTYFKTFIDMIDVNAVSHANNLLLKLLVNNFDDYIQQLETSKNMLTYLRGDHRLWSVDDIDSMS